MKTIEETAIEFAKTKDCPACAKEGFIAGVAFAQQWIRVEDELPEEGVKVLVKFDDNAVEFGILRKNEFFPEDEICYYFESQPKYWRPIELK